MARTPFLYADVPSTMSFAIWSITLRQNRRPTLPDTPVGSDSASGRWVARTRHDAERRADLDDERGVLGGLLAVLLVGEQVLALVDDAADRPQPQAALRARSRRVTLLSGHTSRGSARSRSVPPLDLAPSAASATRPRTRWRRRRCRRRTGGRPARAGPGRRSPSARGSTSRRWDPGRRRRPAHGRPPSCPGAGWTRSAC